MSKFPFITILTASFNSEATIRKTLESIRDQTFQDLEHIVIDGGSCDETLDIVKKYENTYNLQWISEPDHCISDALNKGLRLSSGRYIIVIQADDQLLTPEILKNVYMISKSERFDIYSFPVLKYHPDKGKFLYKPVRILWWHHFKTIFPHQGCFVHKRLFDRIGGFRKEFSIALDYDFFYRALHSGTSVGFGQMPVAFMGGAGISSNPSLIHRRLQEERKVQQLNATNRIWRIFQAFFHLAYDPYKLYLFPRIFGSQQGGKK